MMPLITLLTDFGLRDEYVGVMKGVISSLNDAVRILDISHDIDPQDVTAAAYMLMHAYPFFPRGSIHVAVVDPGVGSHRSIISAQVCDHFFLAPDNGLLLPLIEQGILQGLHQVENEALFRHPVSSTFHGRDIFAPVAAHLASDGDLKKLGKCLNLKDLRPLGTASPRIDTQGFVQGKVIGVDRFGNLVTNIDLACLARSGMDIRNASLRISIGTVTLRGITHSYYQGSASEPVALIGSRGCLEIAVNQGHAARMLGIGKGADIQVSSGGNS